MLSANQLDPEQQQAVDAIVHSAGALAITGGPGVGKTTTLATAIHELELAKKNFLLLAPTGKAALNITRKTQKPASTIHRLLWTKNADEMFSGVDVVIIDEASMVDTEILGQLSTLLLLNSNARLVLVGDHNQLPPVGPGLPFEDILAAGTIPRVHLKTIHRQKGENWVIDNAYRVLDGEMIDLSPCPSFQFIESTNISRDVLQFLAMKYGDDVDPSAYQVLSPQRIEQDKWDTGATTQRINKLVQEGSSSRGGTYTARWGEVFREGDRVIQTKNNYSAHVVNGQMGEVVFADSECLTVRFDEEGTVVTYRDGAGGVNEDGRPTPSPSELDVAYAITVHKSQGSQWREVCLVADKAHKRMLQRRLFYTAITRCEEKLTIIGSEEAIVYAIKANTVANRNTLLAEKLKGEVALYGTASFQPGT